MKTLSNLSRLIDSTETVQLLKNHSSPLETLEDLDPLMDYKGDTKYVLLDEKSHGTIEY